MNWDEQLYKYCERGSDPSFWAEPVNALTNIAFFVAAAVTAKRLMQRRREGSSAVPLTLIGLVAVMGAGSFCFHTFATRWAYFTDVGPISIFMLAYFGFALRALLSLSWTVTLAGVTLFALTGVYVAGIKCGGAPCLNETLGYAPALAAMFAIGLIMRLRRPAVANSSSREQDERRRSGLPPWALMLTAAGIFALSISFRVVDIAACDRTVIVIYEVGTHFLWHILNALVLYLLLRIAVDHGENANFAPPAP